MQAAESARIKLARIIILVALAGLCRFGQAAPLPPNQTLYDAAFGDTAFVSVGANGTIYSSLNAGPWELRPSGTIQNLQAVAYGDGMFVVAGGNGTLLSSSNGVDWVVRATNGAWITPKIAFGNGTFIVGAKGPGSVWTMLRSTNAVDWQAINVDAPGLQDLPQPFGGIAFGEGRFIAIGGRHGANLILTSTDGLVWREQGANLPSAGNATQGPITYGSGKFAMVVNHYTDDDDGSSFDQVLLSDDGISWQNTGFGAGDVPALAAGHCSFVAAVSYFSPSPIWFTYGNYWWTNLSLPAAMTVRAIAHGNGRFVAVGSDIIEFQLPPAGHFLISPQVQNLVAGSFTTFFVDVPPFCLTQPISYQWRKDDIPIPGQTNTYLEFSMVTTNDAGGYSVIAIDHSGLSATSIVAILTVTEYNPEPFPPQISYPVTNYAAVLDLGTHTSIHVHATGWPLPTYQWWFEGVPLPGATNEYVVFYNVDHRAVGNYTVVLSNSLGSATSSVITVTLRTAPPRLSLWYVNHYVLEGDDTPLEWQYYSDLGAPEANYYVFRDGTNSFLPLGSDARFSLRDVTLADQGQYMIVASNSAGMSTGLVVNLTVIPAGQLDRWTRRNPLPQNDPLLEVAYGNGRWVAVGERSSVVVSTNGSDWSAHPLKVDLTLTSVTYGNGLFVAAGAGAILTSPDGVTWTTRVNRRYSSYLTRTVLFANGRFVAVAINSVLTSAHGVDWQEATLPLHVSRYFRSIAYGNGRFVALTQWPLDGPVWTSTDGVNWTSSANGPAADIADLAFGNGLFVGVGDEGTVYTSPDGAVWTSRDSDVSNRLIDITFGNGRFVAVGTRGRIISSANGISWRRETSGTPDRLEGVAFAEGLFIAVGENGTILSSPNTTTWTKRNQGVTRDLDGMAVGNGTIVVVGKGGSIVTSVDGVNFTQRTSGTANDLHGVAWADGLFVAVGEPETILTSPDGIAWTLRHSETNSSLKGAVKGNGTWIAVGTGGALLTSSDGSTWTRRESYTLNDLNSVAYGNGLFVAVGDNLPPNGTLLTSPDGVSWTRRNQYIGKNLRAGAFANNTFVASGNDGVIMVSSNGLTWALRYTGLFGQYDHNLRGIGYADAMWVIVGNAGLAVTSPNAVDWLLRSRQGLDNLHGVGELNGKFVAIGNRGTILQSDSYFQVGPTLRARFVGNGVELTIIGQPGTGFTLEAGPSLTGGPWATIGGSHTFTPGNTTIVLFDPAPTSSNTRFYRAVSR